MLNIETMKRIVESSCLAKISEFYGEQGVLAFREIISLLPEFYRKFDTEQSTSAFIVFKRISGSCDPHAERLSLDTIIADLTANPRPAAIECIDGSAYALTALDDTFISSQSPHALIYHYDSKYECFYVNRNKHQLENPSAKSYSVFCRPIYSDLTEALNHYANHLLRKSRCRIFSQAWLDSNRICFAKKPEKFMRNSLEQYLISSLRDVEVRPEQNIDESHPVDIKITWQIINRIAIIEIKWLGLSIDPVGNTRTPYTESRANSGARQLAEYLDQNAPRSTLCPTRGYLVVVDGRRKLPSDGSVPPSINTSDGMHYANKAIAWTDNHHLTRKDFEPPIRMFAEPICRSI